ncbi:putative transporter [Legionella lansingensis]|uniref:Putative transporter n=1 Tax=Legionella lansingensis TaxID=45067 RepID=A0A0W0VU39_9GAMM|nr:CAP domain-containing protein [Legionella lansingensis]KTD23796.1 putative transporter [Legionella lansingensis]SNV47166.1 putative transporter [Legionella lansingensis]
MKKCNSILYGLWVVFFVILVQSAAANTNNSSVAIGSPMQKAILVYVNEYRAQRGLPPLKMNNLMSKEAEIHSREMATHKISFGHKDFDKRIKRLFTTIKQCRGGSENVAYAYKDAKDVVKNWLTSPGHRRNILGHYNLTGIGLARDSRGKIYFTQIFLRTDNPVYVG